MINHSPKPLKKMLIVSGFLFFFSMLLVRLFHIQVMSGYAYYEQAENNRMFSLPLLADRGVFLDRYGQPLVLNQKQYFSIEDPQRLYYQQTPIVREEALALMASDSARVATKNQRSYVYPESLAHVLGYVGQVTAEELVLKPTRSLHKAYGKAGLEKYFDEQLQGQDGKELYEINALGKRQRLVKKEEPVAGRNITTTIDPWLSQVAYEALGSQKGTVIVADAYSGDILTLVNKPSFDSNQLSQTYVDPKQEDRRKNYVQQLFSDPDQPFFNRAISGVYPPGSVFKLVTALAGLDVAAFDSQTTVEDEGVLKVGEYEYGNWYFRQFGRVEGTISLVRALARSNDIYFYKAAESIGPDRLAAMARRFGFGTPVDVGLSPQAKGIVPDPSWKEKVIGEKWYLGNTYHFGIGQGDILVSPIQIAQLVEAIAHDGIMCEFSLTKDDEQKCAALGLQEEHLSLVLDGMIQACSPGGTAFPFFPRNQLIIVETATPDELLKKGVAACKTGTAEFGAADGQGYRDTHGWFVMIVEPQISPQDQPTSIFPEIDRNAWLEQTKADGFPQRLVMVVMVESDEENQFKEGSRDAAPVVKDLLDWMEGENAIQGTVTPEEAAQGE